MLASLVLKASLDDRIAIKKAKVRKLECLGTWLETGPVLANRHFNTMCLV